MNNAGDLGRRVAERRAELGLTTEAVATRAGMAEPYLRSLEANPSPQISRAALWRLAAALETTVDAITGGGIQAPPGQAKPSGKPVLDRLTLSECQGLVDSGGVGRVVFSASRGPVALPVNFRMLDGDVVFRTGPSPEMASSFAQHNVSFEVDHLDEALAEGWSVLLTGVGHVVVDPDELERVHRLAITPWAAGQRDVYARIVVDEVSGRRIRQVDGHSVSSG